MKRFYKTRTGVLGLIILIFFVILASGARYICPPTQYRSPYEIPRRGFGLEPRPPRVAPPFGTTEGQYDLYYGVVWGTRFALTLSLIVVSCSCLIGAVIGAFSGFYGGIIDTIMMRITDIFLAFPFLFAAMILAAVLGRGFKSLIISIVAFRWMPYARLIRGEVLRLKSAPFVEACLATGATSPRILFLHILPNSIYPVLVQATMDIGGIVMSASALSFLGLGMDVGYADWGVLISMARNWLITGGLRYWYTLAFPGGALFLYCLAWNLVGDAVRDVLDPRLRGLV
ncbi:MAG: ABC transporter permease [Candidatus Methanomethylicaceae archaeon]